MQVPGTPSAAPTQDNQPKPGPALLLMAAAEMQRMGKLQDTGDASLRTRSQRGKLIEDSKERSKRAFQSMEQTPDNVDVK